MLYPNKIDKLYVFYIIYFLYNLYIFSSPEHTWCSWWAILRDQLSGICPLSSVNIWYLLINHWADFLQNSTIIIILGWYWLKFAQRFGINAEFWLPWQHKENNLKIYRNHWSSFNILWQKCSFGDPLPRLFKPWWFVKKKMFARGGTYFLLYIFIANFKNLLIRNY